MRYLILIWTTFFFNVVTINVEGESVNLNRSKNVQISDDVVDGEYVGGLNNGTPVYKNIVNKRTYNVKNKTELIDALKRSKRGEVVYIKDDAVIDLSNVKKLIIPGGVTLASGRGKGNSKGALLFTKTNGTRPLIGTGGNDIRITGIRIEGPDTEIYAKGNALAGKSAEDLKKNRLNYYRKNMYGVPVSDGVTSWHQNLEIDNCELYGWTYGAIHLRGKGVRSNIHHNYIHHNQRFGLGYGVVLDGSTALIKANLFDFNRHSVAGTGRKNTGYEVCYNKFMENNNGTWAIDMHGGKDRNDGTDLAGSDLLIHNNTIRLNDGALAVVIRGIPSKEAKIYDNQIICINKKVTRKTISSLKNNVSSKANVSRFDQNHFIQQRNAQGKFSVSNNKVEQN
ncbi:hypothetical protein [Olivibacter domesticus]|uniref:Right handed beta helix region n=1 Tax=Olivibacter domesticus TaxID=407022 RepID=A0A1H7UWU6_OLID1|nr:hypothetical protein [Olivibacter domesticus]SEM01314.1 hypothetical protein SAMN05661044_03979 [Olivibacter domesticus]